MEEFLDKLRPQAVYFKLTSDSKYGDAVSVNDIINVLENLKESYQSYVDAEYEKINTIVDNVRLKKIKTGLEDENNLMVVDLTFSSCCMAVAPNVVTYKNSIPNIPNQIKWKSEVFENYKNDVIKADYNDEIFLKRIEQKYNPVERQKIFKPIVDGIIKNSKSKISFGIGVAKYDIILSTPTNKSYNSLIPKEVEFELQEEEVIRTSLARVEIKSNGRIDRKPKVLELFDDTENPILTFHSLTFADVTYKFKFPLYCELITQNDGSYLLENTILGIFTGGVDQNEAKQNFAEEFDYILKRYNSLPDEKLTAQVIETKKYINIILDKNV